MATADIEGTMADAGPPLRVPYETPSYYGNKQFPPGDFYSDSTVRIAAMRADVAPMLAFASRALHARLEKLAPGTLEATPMLLVAPDGSTRDYVAMTPRVTLEARAVKHARPGDLQWATFAFSSADVTAPLLSLQVGDSRMLVVSRAVGEALDVHSFADVELSAFHRTPAKGGARPAVAALTRMLEGKAQPDDVEVVRASMAQTPKTRTKVKAKTRPSGTAKVKATKPKPKPKPKAKASGRRH